jgi:hypothetical protein
MNKESKQLGGLVDVRRTMMMMRKGTRTKGVWGCRGSDGAYWLTKLDRMVR